MPRPDSPSPIRRLHHVQITVPSGQEEAARLFYCGILGLPEIAKPEMFRPRGGLWLTAGGQEVHIGVEDVADRSKTKAHLAYEVTGLPAWQAWLEAHGVELLAPPPIPGYRRTELRDPFGNRVELIEPLEEGE